MRHKHEVTVWHGESGSLFTVVRYHTENEEDWTPLKSFKTLEEAQDYAEELNFGKRGFYTK